MVATFHEQTEGQPHCLLLLPFAELNGHRSNVFDRCVQVTGITLSKEQLAEAKLRVKQAGLDDRIELLFCDYRWAAEHHATLGSLCSRQRAAAGLSDALVLSVVSPM